MVLRKMEYDLTKDRRYLPLYIQVEPWLASAAAALTFRPPRKVVSRRDRDLSASSRVLLALAVVDALNRSRARSVLARAIAQFPQEASPIPQPSSRTTVRAWIQRQLSVAAAVIDHGDVLSDEYKTFPSLFAFAQGAAAAAKDSGKTLVLLLDQVEGTSPLYFNAVASLLRRADYLAIVATRPCPTAPMTSTVPSSRDYRVRWLGADHRNRNWQQFVDTIVADAAFRDDVLSVIRDRREAIISLVGPSARSALELLRTIGEELDRLPHEDLAWQRASTHWRDEHVATAGERISAWCHSSANVLSKIRDAAYTARQRSGLGPGPVLIKIAPGAEAFGNRTAEFLRVCVREGILIPVATERFGVESLTDTYEIDPLVIAPRESRALALFSRMPVSVDISEDELLRWTRSPTPSGGGRPKRVFVSYWMSSREERNGAAVPALLKEQLLGSAEVITGDDFRGSVSFSTAIRKLIIQSATIVVVDLSAARREIFVEFGWAIGAMKRVVLCCRDPLTRGELPGWVRELQVRLYARELLERFIHEVIQALEAPPDDISTWKSDPTLRSLKVVPERNATLLIGPSGSHFDEIRAASVAVHREVALKRPDSVTLDAVDGVAHRQTGGILYDVILAARRCQRMILIFSGSEEIDLLLCVAGGVFTTRDRFKNDGKLWERRLLLVCGPGTDADQLPALLKSKPGTQVARQAKDVQSILRNWVRGS